jgi:hypothetical protein
MWARLRRVLGGRDVTGGEIPGADRSDVARTKAQVEAGFLSMEGVVSVGLGRDREGHDAIIVGVRRERSKTAAVLPHDVDGVPIVVEEVGELKAEEEPS